MIAAWRIVWALLRTPWGAGVAATLAALVALWWWGESRESAGAQAERAKIERNEQEARDATFEAFRNVDRCADAGGVWDRAAARCRARVP